MRLVGLYHRAGFGNTSLKRQRRIFAGASGLCCKIAHGPLVTAVFLWCLLAPDASQATEKEAGPCKAGVASKVITPKEPLWMGGYGSRNKPAEEKLHDLRIKALALEDAKGEKLVLLTSDL